MYTDKFDALVSHGVSAPSKTYANFPSEKFFTQCYGYLFVLLQICYENNYVEEVNNENHLFDPNDNQDDMLLLKIFRSFLE